MNWRDGIIAVIGMWLVLGGVAAFLWMAAHFFGIYGAIAIVASFAVFLAAAAGV